MTQSNRQRNSEEKDLEPPPPTTLQRNNNNYSDTTTGFVNSCCECYVAKGSVRNGLGGMRKRTAQVGGPKVQQLAKCTRTKFYDKFSENVIINSNGAGGPKGQNALDESYRYEFIRCPKAK